MLKNYRLMLLYLTSKFRSNSLAFQMYFDLYVELDRVDNHPLNIL